MCLRGHTAVVTQCEQPFRRADLRFGFQAQVMGHNFLTLPDFVVGVLKIFRVRSGAMSSMQQVCPFLRLLR